MGKIIRNLKSGSGAVLGLVILLIITFFILNWLAQRGWGPVSGIAGWAESHANGSAYGASVPVVGIPNTGFGPAL